MVARSRLRVDSQISGSYRYFGPDSTQTATTSASLVRDNSGRILHGPFSRAKFEVMGGVFSAQHPDNLWQFDNCPFDWLAGIDLLSLGFHAPVPDSNILLAKLLASTNPSKPDVSLPNLAYELREIPGTIRDLGIDAIQGFLKGRFLRTSAKANLAYQFGLAPLISDVSKMLDFTGNVEKRFNELKKMRNDGGKVSKRTVYEGAATLNWNNVLHSRGPFIESENMSVASVRVKGYVQWALDKPLPSSDAKLLNLARRASLGLSVDPTVAWNMMPWSWLIDWFSNTDDIATGSQNIIGASPVLARLMPAHLVATQFAPKHDGALPMVVYQDHIGRYDPGVSPNFAATLPILTSRQWGILGSLAIVKAGRGSNPYKL